VGRSARLVRDPAGVRHEGSGTRTLGHLLRERRIERGWTQREAAARAGVSVGAWRSTESGERRPRPHTFAAILASLDLTLDEVHRTPTVLIDDVEEAREELVRRCLDQLPAEQVGLVLEVVDLAIAAHPPPGRREGR
jgi:transcriptional regulator with XRE-family HTH domain